MSRKKCRITKNIFMWFVNDRFVAYLGISILCAIHIPMQVLRAQDTKLNVLLLSGSNNHNWQETTPLIDSLLVGSGKFLVQITHRPDTMDYINLRNMKLW